LTNIGGLQAYQGLSPGAATQQISGILSAKYLKGKYLMDMSIKSFVTPKEMCALHDISVRSLASVTGTSTVELQWPLQISCAT
jgi:hypothetical protein